jgi:Flp pilus assembly protein TadG
VDEGESVDVSERETESKRGVHISRESASEPANSGDERKQSQLAAPRLNTSAPTLSLSPTRTRTRTHTRSDTLTHASAHPHTNTRTRTQTHTHTSEHTEVLAPMTFRSVLEDCAPSLVGLIEVP